MTTMFSPPRREKARDEDHLPKGGCRFILLHPDAKGMRCACVGFALNRTIPGSTCDCGHQACYHKPDQDAVERQELDALKEKVSVLEQELNHERHAGRGGLVDRLGRLEEMVEKTTAENEVTLKNLHRGIGGLWHHVGLLNKRTPYYDDHIEGLADDVQRIRNRLEEVDDAAMGVEDRVEIIETSLDLSADSFPRRRKASTPPSEQVVTTTELSPSTTTTPTFNSRTADLTYTGFPSTDHPHTQPSIQASYALLSSTNFPFTSTSTSTSLSWTVHVSLLPISSQPFPFEKDTSAYKRCLSRGLHRVLVIPSPSSTSITTTISSAFSEILCGRPWRPLVARLCDAQNLRGLPMLRQLDEGLWENDWDWVFLRDHCAVVDGVGKILDLYVAMVEDSLSWVELRAVSVVLPGLDDAWRWDPLLDGPAEKAGGVGESGPVAGAEKERRPAAGDIVPTWSATASSVSSPVSSKRGATEISRSDSFREGDAAEGRRVRRVCTGGVKVVGRRAEAV